MKYNSLVFAAALAGIIGAGVSCSDDWDSHYESVTHGDGSLWQAISNNPDLSNFRDVLDACGVKASLDGSQVFTVFAPTNACFTAEKRDSVIALFQNEASKGVRYRRNAAIKEFVQNHIALYNYSVSKQTNDSIVMMNGKYIGLSTSAFDGKNFALSNVQANNGILFTITDVAGYKPNIYEYLRRDADLDSVAGYIYEYSLDRFIPSASVPGEIVDGKTIYLDSVTALENEVLSSWLGAELNDEDSTYWYIAPTNRVWTELINEYETYYQYDRKVNGRDSLGYNLPRWSVILGTAFSKSQNPDKSIRDSIMSTNAVPYNMRKYMYGSYDCKYYQYDAPYAEGGVFDGAKEIVCSNGWVMKTDTWNIDKRNIFMFDIDMEGEGRITLDSVYSSTTRKTLNYRSVANDNPFYGKISNNAYAEITNTGNGNYTALFNVRNVLSNVPYDVYVVVAPAVAGDTLVSEAQRAPHKFRCSLQCHDMEGTPYYITSGGEMIALTEDESTVTKLPTKSWTSDFTTDPTRVDSVLIGTWTFPTSSMNLDEAQVKMFIQGRVSSSDFNNGKATKTLRLDCISLKPHLED